MRELILISILISACAQPPQTDNSIPGYPRPTKGLNTIWSNQTESFDLTKIKSSTIYPVDYTFADGAVCETDLNVVGANSVGDFTITTSVYIGGGMGDPGCTALIDTYTYKNPTGYALIVCNSLSICSTYR